MPDYNGLSVVVGFAIGVLAERMVGVSEKAVALVKWIIGKIGKKEA